MSDTEQTTYWNRLAIEGFVIVVSILLAFAVDAWWDERQKRDSEIQQLNRVAAELEINAARIQTKLETLSRAREATSEFISWMGPKPTIVSPESFSETFVQMYSIGMFRLVRAASEDYLAAGLIDSVRSAEVRYALSEWYSLGNDLEKMYELLREAHTNLGGYLIDSVPTLHLDKANRVMAEYPASKFQFDNAAVLSDPRIESRISLYLIRLEYFARSARSLLDRQTELLALVESFRN